MILTSVACQEGLRLFLWKQLQEALQVRSEIQLRSKIHNRRAIGIEVNEAIIPSLADDDDGGVKFKDSPGQTYSSFFKSSSSSEENGVPQVVFIVGIVLWFLSTRLGTSLLCGFMCLDWRFPFVHKIGENE